MSKIFEFDFANPTATSHVHKVQGGQGAFSFDIISEDLDAANSTVSFSFSNDNENFISIPIGENTAIFTLPIGDDSNSMIIQQPDHRYYKMSVSVGAVTVGTIKIFVK